MAVVDSIFSPGDVGFDLAVGVNKNYIASDECLTTPHGHHVLHTISEYVPEAIFESHRVVIDNGKFKPSNYLKAMGNICGRSVDIVNVSGGIHHGDCNQRCRVCRATAEVVNNGTLVIAGAGNQTSNEGDKTLYCPALSADAIAIGSYETRCGLNIFSDSSEELYRTVPQNIYPPGSYWVSESQASIDGEPTETPFCSRQSCSAFHSCKDHRREQLSNINISFSRGEPDVFAPDHYIFERADGTVGLKNGTSFATALVTGALGDVLSAVIVHRPSPMPAEVMNAIRSIPTTVEGTSQRKFDSEAVYNYLL